MKIGVANEYIVCYTSQETSDNNKWDEDKELGVSVTMLKTLQEAIACFNSTVSRDNVLRCKLKFMCKYADANGTLSDTCFVLAHYCKGAKSLERYVERGREWSDNPKHPFEQTIYIHSRLNSRQLVNDAFKPVGTFLVPDEPVRKKIKEDE